MINQNNSNLLTPSVGWKTILWIGTLVIYMLFVFFAWETSAIHILDIGSHSLNVGGVFILVILAHVFFSLKRVGANERGALYFYGRYLAEVGPGLHWVPAGGLTNILTFPRDYQTILEPGPRDSIYWGDEKTDLPDGKVRPIFMNTRAANDNESGMLDVQMTVGVTYTVLWAVLHVATFVATLHTLVEGTEQIRQLSERILAEIIAERTADGAITKQKEVNEELKSRLAAETEGWGIYINVAGLTAINLSHGLNEAMRDRAEAQFKADSKVIEATADAEATKLRGEADGKAAHARALGDISGRAEGMKLIKDGLEVTGSEALAAETARATIPGSNATILGADGLIQAAGIGAVFGQGLKSSGEKK